MRTRLFFVILVLATLEFAQVVSATKDSKEAKLVRQARITMAEARKTALARIPGNVESGKIEREKGKVWFEFEIHKAGSGAEADTLCRSIKSEGGDCQVKR